MQTRKLPLVWTLGSLCICVGISAILSLNIHRNNQKKAEAYVIKAAEEFANKAVKRIELYQYGLRGARGFVLAEGKNLSRQRFLNYTLSRDIDREFPGARGFGVIRRVAPDAEAEFLSRAREDGKPDFAIRELNPNTGERYVIQYVEPVERNLPAVGLDIASEAHRRAAADAALRTGQVQLTAPITLVQATGNPQQSFLILLPIYPGWATPASETERVATATGWTYAPLLMEEILNSLAIDTQDFLLQLTDIGDPEEPIVFYKNQNSPATEQGLFSQRLERDVLGRQWQIDFSATPAFIAQLHQVNSFYVFLAGGIFSILVSLLATVAGINQRTKLEAQQQQAKLAAIIQSTSDAIIGKTLDGVVTSWNKGAENLFGYTEVEALGKSLIDLIMPPDLVYEEIEILKRLKRGEIIQHFVTRRHRKNGSIVDVSVNVSPVRDQAGNILGASKTVRDITDIKEVEKRILKLNTDLERKVRERTQELDIARHSLQTVLDNVPSVIGYWDNHQVNKVANQAHQQRFGLAAINIPGMQLRALLGPILYKKLKPALDSVLNGLHQTLEHSIFQGGHNKHYLLQLFPDRNSEHINGFYLIEHDITEITEKRLQLANALRENKALLNTINQQFLLSITDINGMIVEVNDQFCVASGYSRDELIGETHHLINSGYHPREFWKNMWQAVLEGKTWRAEVCNRTKTGEIRWFDSVIAPFVDESGKINRFIALCSDMTERKHAEQQQKQLHQLIENVLAAASKISIIATDTEGLITIFNKGAERMLGYSASEMVGKTTPAIIHAEDEVIRRGKELSAKYQTPINGFQVFVYHAEMGEPETRQWTYIRKNGSSLQVSLSVTAMYDSDRKLIGYLGIALDVTNQLLAQSALAAARDQLSIATDVAQLGVWTWTLEDNKLWWNERMFTIYEQPTLLMKHGLVYTHWSERVHPDDLPKTEAKLMAAVEGTGVYDPIFRIRTPLGGEKYILAGAQVERDKSGNAIKVTGINMDITDQYQLEHELRSAKQLADDASTAKSHFLANMSHEIRTPMNAVLGMLQLVQQTQLQASQRDYIVKAHVAAKSLLGLLNDILDFSKIDAGKLQLDPHPFSLEELLQDLAVVLSGSQRDKSVEVIFDIPLDLPSLLLADRLRLQQILVNLASNALKFTAEGHVVIRLTRLAQTASRLDIRISIEDTGIGISPEQQQRIFDGFTQAEASTTRRFGGTGLGLAICKRLLNLMQSTLNLESELGRGSRFWFDLQCPIVDNQPISEYNAFTRKNLKILVVEDNPLLANLFTQSLRGFNWSVTHAAHGKAALDSIKTAKSQGNAYDAVIMDWQMPELDGISTAQHIHQDSTNTKAPAIILVTAYEPQFLEDIDQETKALFADTLTKPITPYQLGQSIWRAIHGTPKPTPQSESSKRTELTGLRLLVVEDNALNRQVARELLIGAGAEVELADGGIEGVHKVQQYGHSYDLVIMDIQMPDIDGYEATRRIRSLPEFSQLPILAMTANASPADRQTCLDAGMNDHIGKPIDLEQLIPLILTLTRRESPALLNHSDSQLQSPTSTTQEKNSDELIEPLHLILKRFGGNQELFERLESDFEKEMQRLTGLLMLEHQQSNNPASILHSIKGVAATLGAKALSRQAAILEQRCRSEQDALHHFGETDFQTLQDLIKASTDALDKLRKNTVANIVPAVSALNSGEINQLLNQLIELLKQDNMSALDVIEQLQHQLAPSATLQRLSEEINQLNFKSALETATQLFQSE